MFSFEDIYYSTVAKLNVTFSDARIGEVLEVSKGWSDSSDKLIEIEESLLKPEQKSTVSPSFTSVAAEGIIDEVKKVNLEFASQVLGHSAWAGDENPAGKFPDITSEAIDQVPKHCFCLWIDCLCLLLEIDPPKAVRLFVESISRAGKVAELRKAITNLLDPLFHGDSSVSINEFATLSGGILQVCIKSWYTDRMYKNLICRELFEMVQSIRHRHSGMEDLRDRKFSSIETEIVSLAARLVIKGLVRHTCYRLMHIMEYLREYGRLKESTSLRINAYEASLARIGSHLRGNASNNAKSSMNLSISENLLYSNEKFVLQELWDNLTLLMLVCHTFHLEDAKDFSALLAVCPSPFALKGLSVQLTPGSGLQDGLSAEDFDLFVEQNVFERRTENLHLCEMTPTLTLITATSLLTSLLKINTTGMPLDSPCTTLRLEPRTWDFPKLDGKLVIFDLVSVSNPNGRFLHWFLSCSGSNRIGETADDGGSTQAQIWSEGISRDLFLDRLRMSVILNCSPSMQFDRVQLRMLADLCIIPFQKIRLCATGDKFVQVSALLLADSLIRRTPELSERLLFVFQETALSINLEDDEIDLAGKREMTITQETARDTKSRGSSYMITRRATDTSFAHRDHKRLLVATLVHIGISLYMFGSETTREMVRKTLFLTDSPLARRVKNLQEGLEQVIAPHLQSTKGLFNHLIKSDKISVCMAELEVVVRCLGTGITIQSDMMLCQPDWGRVMSSADEVVTLALGVLAVDCNGLTEKLGLATALFIDSGNTNKNEKKVSFMDHSHPDRHNSGRMLHSGNQIIRNTSEAHCSQAQDKYLWDSSESLSSMAVIKNTQLGANSKLSEKGEESIEWVVSLTSLLIGALSILCSEAVVSRVTDLETATSILLQRLSHLRVALWLISVTMENLSISSESTPSIQSIIGKVAPKQQPQLSFQLHQSIQLRHTLAESRTVLLISIMTGVTNMLALSNERSEGIPTMNHRDGSQILQLVRFAEAEILPWLLALKDEDDLTPTCYGLLSILFKFVNSVLTSFPASLETLNLELAADSSSSSIATAAYLASMFLSEGSPWLETLIVFATRTFGIVLSHMNKSSYVTESQQLNIPAAHMALKAMIIVMHHIVLREDEFVSLGNLVPHDTLTTSKSYRRAWGQERSSYKATDGFNIDFSLLVVPGMSRFTEKFCRFNSGFIWNVRPNGDDSTASASKEKNEVAWPSLVSTAIKYMHTFPDSDVTLKYLLPIFCAASIKYPYELSKNFERLPQLIEWLQVVVAKWLYSEKLQAMRPVKIEDTINPMAKMGDRKMGLRSQSEFARWTDKSSSNFSFLGPARKPGKLSHRVALVNRYEDFMWKQLREEILIPQMFHTPVRIPANEEIRPGHYFLGCEKSHSSSGIKSFVTLQPTPDCNHLMRFHGKIQPSHEYSPEALSLAADVPPRRRILDFMLVSLSNLQKPGISRHPVIHPVELIVGLESLDICIHELQLFHPNSLVVPIEDAADIQFVSADLKVLVALQSIVAVDVPSLVNERGDSTRYIEDCIYPFVEEAERACEVLVGLFNHTSNAKNPRYPMRSILARLPRERCSDSGEPFCRPILEKIPNNTVFMLAKWYKSQARLLRTEFESRIIDTQLDYKCSSCMLSKIPAALLTKSDQIQLNMSRIQDDAVTRRNTTRLSQLARILAATNDVIGGTEIVGGNLFLRRIQQATNLLIRGTSVMPEEFSRDGSSSSNLEIGLNLQEELFLVYLSAIITCLLPISASTFQNDAILLANYKRDIAPALNRAYQVHLSYSKNLLGKQQALGLAISTLNFMIVWAVVNSIRIQRVAGLQSEENTSVTADVLSRSDLIELIITIFDTWRLAKLLKETTNNETVRLIYSIEREQARNLPSLVRNLEVVLGELLFHSLEIDKLCVLRGFKELTGITSNIEGLEFLDEHLYGVDTPVQAILFKDAICLMQNTPSKLTCLELVEWLDATTAELTRELIKRGQGNSNFGLENQALKRSGTPIMSRPDVPGHRNRLLACLLVLKSILHVTAIAPNDTNEAAIQSTLDTWNQITESSSFQLIHIYTTISAYLSEERAYDGPFLRAQLAALHVGMLFIASKGYEIWRSMRPIFQKYHYWGSMLNIEWEEDLSLQDVFPMPSTRTTKWRVNVAKSKCSRRKSIGTEDGKPGDETRCHLIENRLKQLRTIRFKLRMIESIFDSISLITGPRNPAITLFDPHRPKVSLEMILGPVMISSPSHARIMQELISNEWFWATEMGSYRLINDSIANCQQGYRSAIKSFLPATIITQYLAAFEGAVAAVTKYAFVIFHVLSVSYDRNIDSDLRGIFWMEGANNNAEHGNNSTPGVQTTDQSAGSEIFDRLTTLMKSILLCRFIICGCESDPSSSTWGFLPTESSGRFPPLRQNTAFIGDGLIGAGRERPAGNDEEASSVASAATRKLDILCVQCQIMLLRCLALEAGSNTKSRSETIIKQNRVPDFIEVLLISIGWFNQSINSALSENAKQICEQTIICEGLMICLLLETVSGLCTNSSELAFDQHSINGFLTSEQRSNLIDKLSECLYITKDFTKGIESSRFSVAIEVLCVLDRLCELLQEGVTQSFSPRF